MAPTRPDDAAERRAGRADWPVRRFRLDDEPHEDLLATTTAAERVAMMWPLAVEAWSVAGRAIPSYPRHAAPVRLYGPGEPRQDDETT